MTWFARFDKEGLKVMAHATGSLSVRHFLNAVEAVRRANGKGSRHHMAHSMLVYPYDLPRMDINRSNIVTEVSPFNTWGPDPHGTNHWKTIIGEDLFDQTMTPIRSMTEAGRRGDLRQRLGQHTRAGSLARARGHGHAPLRWAPRIWLLA